MSEYASLYLIPLLHLTKQYISFICGKNVFINRPEQFNILNNYLLADFKPLCQFCSEISFLLFSKILINFALLSSPFNINHAFSPLVHGCSANNQSVNPFVDLTYPHEVFNSYVKMDRLSLTDSICIDKVFLDMDAIKNFDYAICQDENKPADWRAY